MISGVVEPEDGGSAASRGAAAAVEDAVPAARTVPVADAAAAVVPRMADRLGVAAREAPDDGFPLAADAAAAPAP